MTLMNEFSALWAARWKLGSDPDDWGLTPISAKFRFLRRFAGLENLALRFRSFFELVLPFRAVYGRCNLNGGDLVLRTVGCPVAVFGRHNVRAGFRVMESRIHHTRLNPIRHCCAQLRNIDAEFAGGP